MEFFVLLWDEIITKPMTNSLLLLYVLLFSNLGLAIIAFTFIARALTYPLVRRQLKQTQRLQGLQPKMKEVQERYKNDPQKRGAEMMRVYKEAGVNPVGCLGPLVIQMPIFIGLFWAINNVVPFTPENLAGLSEKLYSWLPRLDTVVPVNRTFLGMDLALEPMKDRNILGMILVGLSGVTMFVQQKMTQTPSIDPQQQSTQRMMLWMFPAMFTMFSLFFPLGLVLYWVASNLIGIVMQYFITGWGGLRTQPAAAGLSPTLRTPSPTKEQEHDGTGEPHSDREDGGRSHRTGNSRARRRPRRNRSRRHQ